MQNCAEHNILELKHKQNVYPHVGYFNYHIMLLNKG